MNLMMRGSVENPLERTQFSHKFCMQPELIEQIQLQVNQIVSRRYYQSHWKIAKLFQKIKYLLTL